MKYAGMIAAVSVAAIGATTLAVDSADAQRGAKQEKCYGVVAKGQNDCGNSRHSCAGEATANNMPDEWLYLPAGTCQRLTNGKLTPS